MGAGYHRSWQWPAVGRRSEAVAWLTEHFVRAAGSAWQVRVQDTLFMPRGGAGAGVATLLSLLEA